MATLKRYMRLYKVQIVQFFKIIMQSKVDFLMGLLGFFFTQLSGILFLLLIFEQIPSFDGWTLDQLIFIYGFAQIPRGIDHLFTDNIWMIAWRMVINGEFDRYMLRPMNLLFQVVSEKLQPDAVGELLVGTILVIVSIVRGVVVIDALHVLMFFVSVFACALIYSAIKLFFASLAFWVKISGPFLQAAYNMADHHAVEHINSARNSLKQVGRSAHSHQITRLVLRHYRAYHFKHFVHLFSRFTHCKSSDGISFTVKCSSMFHRFATKVRIDTTLNDREKSLRISVKRFCLVEMLYASLQPPLSQFQ